MSIKAVFPINTSNITVSGLYQWDYGQMLEIECYEVGSEIVEVHFACTGMSEAIVRPCTFHEGIGDNKAGIPFTTTARIASRICHFWLGFFSRF